MRKKYKTPPTQEWLIGYESLEYGNAKIVYWELVNAEKRDEALNELALKYEQKDFFNPQKRKLRAVIKLPSKLIGTVRLQQITDGGEI